MLSDQGLKLLILCPHALTGKLEGADKIHLLVDHLEPFQDPRELLTAGVGGPLYPQGDKLVVLILFTFVKWSVVCKPVDFVDSVEVFYLVRDVWSVVADVVPGEGLD